MSVLDLIKEDESFEFISLKEAINLLATKTKSTTFGMATYLLNKKVHSTLDCYHRGLDYKLYVSSSAGYLDVEWVGENYAFEWLAYIAENEKHLKKFSVSNTDKYNNGCEESFWKRADFFNLDCIKSLNLFGTKEWNILFKKQQYIWDGNYLATQLADNPPLLDINEDQYLSYSFSIDDVDYPDERWMNESVKLINSHPLFFKNKTFSMHEAVCLMVGYEPIETQWDYQNVNWLIDNPKYEEASNFIFSAVRTNLFEKFSNGEYFITSNNLKILLNESNHFIDGFNNKESIVSSNENLIENTNLKNTIANLELDVAIEKMNVRELNEEVENLKERIIEKDIKIEKLKEDVQKEKGDAFGLFLDVNTANDEINQLKTNIEQLKSEQLANSLKSKNLLDLVFDETATERYAPDLVLSIKLWESIYTHTPKNDSHSNMANQWIENNTSYSETQTGGRSSIDRIREIATPFNDWGNKRNKNHAK
ncbi:MAG: hypothetical protein RR487_04500 [Acinetobacter sp.]